jgi:hypothetical protein
MVLLPTPVGAVGRRTATATPSHGLSARRPAAESFVPVAEARRRCDEMIRRGHWPAVLA